MHAGILLLRDFPGFSGLRKKDWQEVYAIMLLPRIVKVTLKWIITVYWFNRWVRYTRSGGELQKIMAAKKCLKCGKSNPHFFTHCIDCGAKLESITRKDGKITKYLKAGLVLVISVILIIFVIFPLVQYSLIYGQNFSETVSAKSGVESQIPEYSLNQAVGNNDLQITVSSARDGENTYNSNKFFIVSVYMKNNRTSGNVKISSSDFELFDSEGIGYFPYGIGSKVMYDFSPSQGSSGELTFVIPQKVSGKKIQFTFPATSATAGNRKVVAFTL